MIPNRNRTPNLNLLNLQVRLPILFMAIKLVIHWIHRFAFFAFSPLHAWKIINIHKITIQGNCIGDKGAAEIANALKTNNKLVELYLDVRFPHLTKNSITLNSHSQGQLYQSGRSGACRSNGKQQHIDYIELWVRKTICSQSNEFSHSHLPDLHNTVQGTMKTKE